jgi:uncharacterized phage protein (TIGR01671 family)
LRDIKFRGYDLDLKKWHYGNYYFYTDTIYCIASDKDHEKNEHYCILFDGFCDWNMPRPHYKAIVDGMSIGQYTGLKDKNSKEIYEGDIVRAENGEIFTVKYGEHNTSEWNDNYELGFYVESNSEEEISKAIRTDIIFWVKHRKLEVIGNIYENQDLLI